jgi:hypothetical protein
MDPIGLTALLSLKTRLSAISTSADYNTDAGEHVYLGPVSVGGGIDVAVVVQFVTETVQGATGNGSYRSFTLSRDFTVSGLIRSDPASDKGEALERLLADIKRALFIYEKPGLELNGKPFAVLSYDSSRLLPRADGNEFETIELTGSLLYNEGFGDPYAVR